jgi:hypothetical protein
MRQWLADPQKMCIKHVSGEHLEAHMFVEAMRRSKRLWGYYDHGLLFGPKSLLERHDKLAKRLEGHKTPLIIPDLAPYPDVEPEQFMIETSENTLYSRCGECRRIRDEKVGNSL